MLLCYDEAESVNIHSSVGCRDCSSVADEWSHCFLLSTFLKNVQQNLCNLMELPLTARKRFHLGSRIDVHFFKKQIASCDWKQSSEFLPTLVEGYVFLQCRFVKVKSVALFEGVILFSLSASKMGIFVFWLVSSLIYQMSSLAFFLL